MPPADLIVEETYRKKIIRLAAFRFGSSIPHANLEVVTTLTGLEMIIYHAYIVRTQMGTDNSTMLSAASSDLSMIDALSLLSEKLERELGDLFEEIQLQEGEEFGHNELE